MSNKSLSKHDYTFLSFPQVVLEVQLKSLIDHVLQWPIRLVLYKNVFSCCVNIIRHYMWCLEGVFVNMSHVLRNQLLMYKLELCFKQGPHEQVSKITWLWGFLISEDTDQSVQYDTRFQSFLGSTEAPRTHWSLWSECLDPLWKASH